MPKHRRELLCFARCVAKAALGARDTAPIERPTVAGRSGGAFVTFWSGPSQAEGGTAPVLRGCVGTLAPTTDLVDTIEVVTRASLLDDRFAGNPVSAAELADLTIEISLLSDLTRTDDPASLVLGTHGIVIRCKGRSGCFLPKVASERAWSAEEFLSNCCTMKAELPADAWRSPKAEVLLFTAEVFSEGASQLGRTAD